MTLPDVMTSDSAPPRLGYLGTEVIDDLGVIWDRAIDSASIETSAFGAERRRLLGLLWGFVMGTFREVLWVSIGFFGFPRVSAHSRVIVLRGWVLCFYGFLWVSVHSRNVV